MATRLFEDSDHAKCYVEARPSYPDELIDFVLDEVRKSRKSFDLAVDVGCGSGQNTFIIATHFKKVIGCDVSKAQVDEGIKRCKVHNVEFVVAPSESLPVPDNSVDLITCAASFHWFEREPFFREVERTLKPGGCVALYGYTPVVILEQDILNRIFEECYWQKMIPFENPRVIESRRFRLQNVKTPFMDSVWRGDFEMRMKQNLDLVLRLHSSYSFYRSFHEANPEQDLLDDITKRCCEVLQTQETPEKIDLMVTYKYHLLLSKKPSESEDRKTS